MALRRIVELVSQRISEKIQKTKGKILMIDEVAEQHEKDVLSPSYEMCSNSEGISYPNWKFKKSDEVSDIEDEEVAH